MGLEAAIRGMRNPMNSWKKSDSGQGCDRDFIDRRCVDCDRYDNEYEYGLCRPDEYVIGAKDMYLMRRLAVCGPVHAKYRRMITVYLDITAPLYWWKEFDTYKVGTVANSCSTMHKIHAKEFTLEDFSYEHLNKNSIRTLEYVIEDLNQWRDIYINGSMVDNYDGTSRIYNAKDKDAWWQMIQLLPSSYNQRRTVMLNYEVLANMYDWRKNHKLDEWRDFCEWIKTLPYSDIITGENNNETQEGDSTEQNN